MPQPAQPGLLETEHPRVGRGLLESVSCSLAAVLAAEPFIHLFHKCSPGLTSPVQVIATQRCPKCSAVPSLGGSMQSYRGRRVNHVVSPSHMNLDCSKFYVGEAPGL